MENPEIKRAILAIAKHLSSLNYEFEVNGSSSLAINCPFGTMSIFVQSHAAERYGFEYNALAINLKTPVPYKIEDIPFNPFTWLSLVNSSATVGAAIDDFVNDETFFGSRLVLDGWSDDYLPLFHLLLGRQVGDVVDGMKIALQFLASEIAGARSNGDISESERKAVEGLRPYRSWLSSFLATQTVPVIDFEPFSEDDLQFIANLYPSEHKKTLDDGRLRIASEWSLDRTMWVPRYATFAIISYSLVDEHPTCGKGLLVRMELPLELEESFAETFANRLNVADFLRNKTSNFLGAWFAKNGKLKFQIFVPNHLSGKHELLEPFICLEERKQFAFEYVAQEALEMARMGLKQRRDDIEQAVGNVGTAFRLAPFSSEINNIMGMIATVLGQTEDALTFFTRATNFNPDHGEAHYNRAMVLEKLGRIDEATEAYESALQAGSSNKVGPIDLSELDEQTPGGIEKNESAQSSGILTDVTDRINWSTVADDLQFLQEHGEEALQERVLERIRKWTAENKPWPS